MKAAFVIVSLLFLIIKCAEGDVHDCTYTVNGKKFDLSPLKKEYFFQQTVVSTADNILTNPNFSDSVNISVQLAICQNVATPMSQCSGTAPVFLYRGDTKKCVSLGSLDVATFEPNPFNDGIYLDYYNGDMVDHITRYEARIYFVCQANVTIDGPIMEHFKESDQAHFHVFTKYAC